MADKEGEETDAAGGGEEAERRSKGAGVGRMDVDGKEEEADSEVDGEGDFAVVSFSLPFFFGMIAGSLVERSIVSTVSVRSIHRVQVPSREEEGGFLRSCLFRW